MNLCFSLSRLRERAGVRVVGCCGLPTLTPPPSRPAGEGARRAAGIAVAAALAGCSATVTPLPIASTALTADFVATKSTAAEPVAEFWKGFGDADLDTLVAEALAANQDLRVAVANLAAARALVDASSAARLPSVGAQAGASRARATSGVARTGNFITSGVQAAWEIDLFGRIGAEVAAAEAGVRGNEAALRAAQVSVAADVARSYFELRAAQELLRVADASLETQRAALKLVQARRDAGRGTALDTERANTLVLTTQASVPALQAQVQRAGFRLAVLTGKAPSALGNRLDATKPLPALAPTALERIGSPANLLRRRPDIAAAEAQLQAAAARIGIARAQLFPSVRLAGALGLNGSRVSALGDSNAVFWNLGASLVWTLFDGGGLRARLASATAGGDAALASYDKAVLAALEDTEGALVGYTRAQEQSAVLFAAAQSAAKAAELARARFGAGASDFLAVLDAERELLAARERLVRAQAGAADGLVGVYRALAGGWGEAAR
jgi:outer membrane protein, multidrug efflux system